eukprot:scaffold2359_cov132-Skeletonema_menzelii.AAC.7
MSYERSRRGSEEEEIFGAGGGQKKTITNEEGVSLIGVQNHSDAVPSLIGILNTYSFEIYVALNSSMMVLFSPTLKCMKDIQVPSYRPSRAKNETQKPK